MITKWHFLMLLIMGIDALDQIMHITELANLVGVKVPNESIEISDWTTDYMGLIVEPQPNNEIHIRSAEPMYYEGNYEFHFLSKTSDKLTFSVENYGHDSNKNSIGFNTCQMELVAALGNSCAIERFKISLAEWDIACVDSSNTQHQPTPDNGFKLEHTKSDRWEIQGLDKAMEERGYSTYSILHMNFAPTDEEMCTFKVIMNSQNAVDGIDSRKGNRDNILLLSRETVPEEFWEELFHAPFSDTTTPPTPARITSSETPSTTPSTTLPTSTTNATRKEKVRWTFPPGNKVFGFMNN